MTPKQGFPKAILDDIHKEKILGICAGNDASHRIIGIWAVVVKGRVYVRSYKMKEGGWWRTLLDDPQALIFVAGRKHGIKVRAVQVKNEATKEAVSAAYGEKYNTRGSVGYVEEMSRSPSKDSTTELISV